jgi:hypothetical protein
MKLAAADVSPAALYSFPAVNLFHRNVTASRIRGLQIDAGMRAI